MAYLDYVGLAYFKSLLDENYLRTNYDGDTTIQGNVTFTEPVDADVKNDYLGNQIDKTYIKDIVLDPEGSGALALVLGDGSVSHLLTNTTVSQVRSSANELYPVLLCYDANAEEAQITKTVKYVHDVQINPSTGYISAKGMYVKHPTFNRRNGVTQKVEWTYDFTDGVTGLGNPMSQVYAYVDPASQGGEHCIELRLYGNPNVSPVVPSINDSTNTFSIGVGVTGGNVRFGYCPSTPLYLDNGSTLRTETTGHGTDIITRDWLNLNGSLTGLVHTTMNETIDGAKTFKKTVTINSGDNSNKAGLYVQGNSDVHGNERVYGTETVDGKLTANGTAEIKGGSGNNPSLLVTGNETVTGKLTGTGTAEFSGGSGNTPTLTVNGNESVTGNETVGGNISTTNGNISTTNGTISGKTGSIGSGGLTVAGNETVTGKITGNNGAEISGGNGLIVNGNETVNGEIYKVVNNTPQEYVSYVTNKQETKTTIVNNLIKDKGGLAVDSNKNIYVNTGKGLNLDNAGKINVDFSQLPAQDVTNIITGMVAPGSGLVADSSTGKLAVDFSQMPTDKFEHMLSALHLPLWIGENGIGTNFYVDISTGVDTTENGYGRSADKPWRTIAYATLTLAKNYNINTRNVIIYVSGGTYTNQISLPLLQRTTGNVYIRPKTANDIVNIEWTSISNGGSVINHSGGSWTIDNCNIKLILAEQNSAYYYYPRLINSSDSTGSVNIQSCNLSFEDHTVPMDSTHGHCEPRLINSGGGMIQLRNEGVYSDHSTEIGRTVTWSGTAVNANVFWLFGEYGGTFVFWNGGQDYNLPYTYNVSGKWNTFANLGTKSQVTSNGIGKHAAFSYDIATIGRGSKGYYITGGASASTGTNSVEAREEYFPRGYTTEEGSTTPTSNFCNTAQFSYISPTS